MASGAPAVERTSIPIPVEQVTLAADLALPSKARGLVLFAHGSGSSRHSQRNRYVAGILNAQAIGTVLADLLTANEEREDERTAQWRFDIDLLARRLTGITDWLGTFPQTCNQPIGLFGASTGAAAALVTAAQRPNLVKAVVSRGGRPDLAGPKLSAVRASTLLIVGGNDPAVLEMNRSARELMSSKSELTVVSGASHLFEEPGTLAQVATLAAVWFTTYLTAEADAAASS